MGGNALKTVKTERISPEKYIEIKQYIKTELEKLDYVVSEIKEVPGKTSYGDLDLLYHKSNSNIVADIKILFKPHEIVKNGEVVSFDYNNFQIDLIFCSSIEQMNFARFYFSYGDLGSILGRFCNYHGLKIGHRGFWLNVYENTLYPEKEFNPTRNWAEILLTQDPRKACDFLGLDYDRYLLKFESSKEIFDWIMTSKYFVGEIFRNLNHDHMERAKKRAMYIEFLEYIGLSIDQLNGEPKIEKNIQHLALEYFDKIGELNQIRADLEYKQVIKSKFSGKTLIELGVDHKNIKKMLNLVQGYIEQRYQKSLETWIYETDVEEIREIVKSIL